MRVKVRDFTTHDIKNGIARNTEKPCSVPNCHRLRIKLSSLCGTHMKRRKRWGSAEHGRRFKQRELETYARIAQEFIDANRAHPGIVAAINYFAERLRGAHLHVAGSDNSAHLARKLRALEDAGVQGEECFVRALAVFLYSRSLPTDAAPEPLIIANMAAQVLRPVPRVRGERIEPGIRRLFGRQLWDSLGVLFVRIAAHQEVELRRVETMRDAFAAPFNPTR